MHEISSLSLSVDEENHVQFIIPSKEPKPIWNQLAVVAYLLYDLG